MDKSPVFQPEPTVCFQHETLHFEYGHQVYGPSPEHRRLDAIRSSLRDPQCAGPDPVYGIVMDVGREQDLPELQRRMLLFGIVAYAAGRLGEEPVRSQGHVHAIAPHCGWSTPELIEVWQGKAIIYLQQHTTDNPGNCYAIDADPGEVVVVPPGWAHTIVNANPELPMVFGAWCDRQYAFLYDDVRAHGGLAWFPLLDPNNTIHWERNSQYNQSSLVCRKARAYPELGLNSAIPIYRQFIQNPEAIQWISDPARFANLWPQFEP